ncbi:MAG: hypothetical protein RSB38_05905 [Oscillospiraceae bacterium]
MSTNPNMANREVCDLIFEDYKTKVPVLNIDYANVTTTELTGETAYAFGGQKHPKRIGFNGERGGTLKIETQIQPFKLWSIISGAKIESTAEFIKREEVVTTSVAPTITLLKTPVVGAPVNVFLKSDDCGVPVPSTVSGTTVTLTTPKADTYVVYYMEAIATGVKKLNIKSTTFAKVYKVYMETFNVTEDDEVVPYKMIAYKCQPQNNITINNSSTGDPVTLTITCDLLADGQNNIIDMIMIEDAV